MLNLNDQLIDVPCPRCDYGLEVALIDIRLEGRIFCPNCKGTIQLQDSEASTEAGLRRVDRSMKDLEKTLRSFGR
jgi:uncharacterized Zn finger protein (UPF0148 family)